MSIQARMAPHARHSRLYRPLLVLLVACALLLPALAAAPPAGAANCTVSSPLNDGYGSLRLLLANTSCTTITFGVPEVRVNSYLTVDRSVTIQGAGQGSTTVRYAGDFSYTGSVFFVSGGTVAFNDLTIAGGRTISLWGAGLGIVGRSGVATVTLTHVKVTDNVARDGGGGGIYASNANLTLVSSPVVANSAVGAYSDLGGGGGIFLDDNAGNVTAMLNGVDIVNNAALNNMGGGIHVRHRGSGKAIRLTIAASSIRFNSALWGGGLLNSGGTVSFSDTFVTGNGATAGGGGGGIYNYAGALTFDRSVLSENTVGDGGSRNSHGGGLYNYYGSVGVSASTVSRNKVFNASLGGGIFNSKGTLTLSTTTVFGNEAGEQGGGIYSDGTLLINSSTISYNHAYSLGGGLVISGAAADIWNTTISNNDAIDGAGGLFLLGTSSPVTLTQVTVVRNSFARKSTDYGAGLHIERGTVRVRQSLIAASYGVEGGTRLDCKAFGTIQSLGDNLTIAGAGCPANGTGDIASSAYYGTLFNPTLASNGGLTQTHNLVPGSAAIDRVPAARCASSSDQRGVARPQGAGCDIGAVEYRP
jgi:predicted outer membrane repeat protein